MFKRKRNIGAPSVYMGVKKVSYKRRKTSTPGRTRTSGYYGRYGGSRGELKFHDLDINAAQMPTAGAITVDSCNEIGQGVTESTRVGRKCTITNIYWKMQMVLPEVDAAVTPSSGEQVRIILYQDKQCNGATATVADILESANYQSYRNLANSGRFNILMDKAWTINYGGLASDGASVVSQAAVIKNAVFNKRCNIPLEFDNTTGAITEIRSNNIGVLTIGSTGLVGLDSKMRLRFSDR